MKTILRFYFSAEELNDTLNKVIYSLAADSWRSVCGEDCFDRVVKAVEAKGELASFWKRLNGVMLNMSEADLKTLSAYCRLRSGTKKLPLDRRREIHRALTKFSRRASRILSASQGALDCINYYYCYI